VAETTSTAKTQVKHVIRDLRLLLALAGFVIAALPVSAQEPVPPLPDRNPARSAQPTDTAAAPPEEKPNLPSDKPTVPWQDPKIASARAACDEILAGITLDYEQLDPIKRGLCGTPAPILVRSVGSDPAVTISPPATMNCKLAVALHAWFKDSVQPAAAVLGSSVVKVRNASSYKCRNRYGGANTRISEHALANALDISEFVFASGQRIKLLRNWPYGATAGPLAPDPPIPNPHRVAAALAREDAALARETTGSIIAVSNRVSVGSALAAVTKVKANPFVRPTPPPEARPPLSPFPRTASGSNAPASTPIATAKSNPFISPLPPEESPPPDPAQTVDEDETSPEPRMLQPEDASAFLRVIHDEACKTFETVLGPEANASHKDHFHLDMKKRRYVKICQ